MGPGGARTAPRRPAPTQPHRALGRPRIAGRRGARTRGSRRRGVVTRGRRRSDVPGGYGAAPHARRAAPRRHRARGLRVSCRIGDRCHRRGGRRGSRVVEAVRHAIELARDSTRTFGAMTAVDPAAEATALAVPELVADVREATIARAEDLLRAARWRYRVTLSWRPSSAKVRKVRRSSRRATRTWISSCAGRAATGRSAPSCSGRRPPIWSPTRAARCW